MSVFQLKTFIDIVNSIREELGIGSTDTNAINRIKRDVNLTYAEIVARKKWFWLSGSVDLTFPAYTNAGTASVTQNSNVVTLTIAPATSKANYKFMLDGYNEIYTIDSHSANSVTVKLKNEFTGGTNATATYKIFNDRIALPTDCKETSDVWHDVYRKPVENVGRQEYRRITTQQPRNEGPAQIYYTGDYVDPSQSSSITSLPSIATRASTLMRKSIVFASAIPTAIVTKVNAGDPVRWHISGSGHPSYNGDIIISSISTTSTANDTITYTGLMEYTESATADSGMSVTQLDQEQDYDRYRELFIYPYLSNSKQTLHVDYYKDVLPLDNDSDEPVVPLEDRIVIRYGALHLSWSRIRNAEEATRNRGLYEQKIAQMEGKWQDSVELPMLRPNKNYLASKRNTTRKRAIDSDFGTLSGGGGSAGQNVTGTINRAAIFGNDGVLVADPLISSTELEYLDGVTSNVQTQIDSKQPTLVNSAGLAAALSDETGTGVVVFSNSPTLVTPALGTPSALVGTNITGTAAGLTAGTVTTNANLTGDITSVGNATTLTNAPVIAKVLTGYTSGAGTVSATDSILQAIQKLNGNDATNANLTGPITSVGNATSVASQTGTGSTFVMNTSPTLITPSLGTPSALVGTNITGTAAGLTAGNVTTNANLTGVITSVGNATSIASQTGTGTKFVVDTSPTLVTPNIGTPSAGVLTNVTGLPLSSGVTGTLPITNGGTGQTTKAPAFDALSPMTTGGDLIYGGASGTGTRLANGNAGDVLTSAGTTLAPTWATPSSSPDQSYELSNLSIACSVGSSALTIALKDKSGSNPSGGSPVKVGFRSATAATGTYSQVSVTGALSTVISSGSTAGHTSGADYYIYVYLMNNAGTAELAWSTSYYGDGSVHSTTAEGGAGAADSNSTIYSTTARTNVAFRCIGRLKSNQTTAGTWAAVPIEISLQPFIIPNVVAKYVGAGGGNMSLTGATDPLRFDSKEFDPFNIVTTGAGFKVTAPVAGYYEFSWHYYSPSGGNSDIYAYKNGVTTSQIPANNLGVSVLNIGIYTIKLLKDEYVQFIPQSNIVMSDNSAYNQFMVKKISDL